MSSQVPTHWERQLGQSQGPILLSTMVGLGLAHVMGWSIKPPPSPALLMQQVGTTGFLLPKCELIKTCIFSGTGEGQSVIGEKEDGPFLKKGRNKQN